MRKELMIKEWFYDKMESTSSGYNLYIDFARDGAGMRKVEDGFVTVYVEEVIGESDKAIQVKLSTGSTVGSVKGWIVWVPKSVIKEEVEEFEEVEVKPEELNAIDIESLIKHKIELTGNDGTFVYNIVKNEWKNYGKHRMYFSVIETRNGSNHNKKYDFGYIDLISGEYVAGKMDATDCYDLSGARIEIMVEPNYAVVITETYDILCVCKTFDEAIRVYEKYEEEDLENDEYEQNYYSIIDMSTDQVIY